MEATSRVGDKDAGARKRGRTRDKRVYVLVGTQRTSSACARGRGREGGREGGRAGGSHGLTLIAAATSATSIFATRPTVLSCKITGGACACGSALWFAYISTRPRIFPPPPPRILLLPSLSLWRIVPNKLSNSLAPSLPPSLSLSLSHTHTLSLSPAPALAPC
jgi:hypothetical protein